MSDHDKLREAIAFVRENWCHHVNMSEGGREKFRLVAAAAESTLPQTKMVEVWHVEYALHSRCPAIYLFTTEDQARKQADYMTKHGVMEGWRCIRVTGPHQQEVPA